MDDLEARVRAIVADELDVAEDQIKLESRFADDLGADSLARVNLIMAMEEEFDAEIPDEEAEKIATFKDAIDYIQAHQKSN